MGSSSCCWCFVSFVVVILNLVVSSTTTTTTTTTTTNTNTIISSSTSSSKCPINMSYVQTIPWDTTACQESNKQNNNGSKTAITQHCCQTLLSLYGIGLSQHLRQTSLFQLPDLETSTACIFDFQSQLNSLSLPSDLSSICFGNPRRFVTGPDVCAGIQNKQDWIDKLGPSTWLDSSCKSDLPACDACVGAGFKVQSKLTSLDGNTSHATDCFYFAVLYAAGVVNVLGPENTNTAACIFGLAIRSGFQPSNSSSSSSSSKKKKNHAGLAFALTGAAVAVVLMLSLLFMYFWFVRHRRRRMMMMNQKNSIHDTESSSSMERSSIRLRPNTGSIWFKVEELERATVPGSLKSEYPPEKVLSQVYSHSQHGVSSSLPGSFIDNLFIIPSIHEKNMGEEEVEDDLSSQWLSNFVEDCLFSSGNCIPPPTTLFKQPSTNLKTTHQTQNQNQNQNPPSSLVEKPMWKSKRTKRKRPTTNPITTWSSSHPHYLEHPQNNQNLLHVNTSSTTYSDPPLLHQAYWLADSELIVPQKENKTSHDDEEMLKKTDDHDDVEKKMGFDPKDSLRSLDGSTSNLGQQPRRCSHCLAQRTPQWRAGPLGPKTLCNACGVRFKSGRLLPEYRPAKSPTSVSYKYSNSHKKVMEMRMSVDVSSMHSE